MNLINIISLKRQEIVLQDMGKKMIQKKFSMPEPRTTKEGVVAITGGILRTGEGKG